MHEPSTPPAAVAPRDCWSLTADELERLAVGLMGEKPGGWVRAKHAVTIASRFQPPDAKTLPAALSALGERARQILSLGGSVAGLRAAAYWHLGFEALHPLRDGNGRVGRFLLARQCEEATRVPAAEILSQLHAFENEYKWVFVPNEPAQRFELLLDLLARITAAVLPEEASRLPLPLAADKPLSRPPQPAPTRGTPTRRSSFF